MPKVHRVRARKTHKCGKCGKEIGSGEEYYYFNRRISYKPPRGVKVKRCINHYPRPSETTGNPRRAQVYALSEQLSDTQDELSRIELDEINAEDYDMVLEEVTEEVRAIGDELNEGAQNIEMGFGWATGQSDEMQEKAQDIERIVYELESLDWPDPPLDIPEINAADPDHPTTEEFEAYSDELEGFKLDIERWRDDALEVLLEAESHVNEVEV